MRLSAQGTVLATIAALSVGACGDKKSGKVAETTAESAPRGALKSAAAVETKAGKLRSLARTALAAYRAKDIEALVMMIPPAEQDEARAAFSPGEPGFVGFFAEDDWRWKAAQSWDGDLGQVREHKERIRVQAGVLDGQVAFTVEFHAIDGSWYFKDFKNPRAIDFEVWGTVVP